MPAQNSRQTADAAHSGGATTRWTAGSTVEPTVGSVLAAPVRYGGLGAVSDGWVIAGALFAAGGAWLAPDVPWWIGAAAVVSALWLRLPWLLPLGLGLVAAAAMSAQAAALARAPAGQIVDTVTVASDPQWQRGALSTVFSARIEGERHRWEGWARGSAAYRLEDASVGEQWDLVASTTLAEPAARRYLWPRHIAGQAQIHEARRHDSGAWPFRFANRLRSLIERSSESLSERDASLLAGFVYGDDRGQAPEVTHDFRATALTHLLAVSGSNVAFVLALLAPLLLRLRPWPRLAAVIAVLAEFAVLTRAEPSVMRACVLAALAVGAFATGRRASVLRLLSLGVIVLLLADPLLVHSVGFQLSVAATAGIALGAAPISRLLVGPAWLRLPLAVTLAAQIGVLPVQLAVFGSLPLVSIPANLLAGPAAGPAMVWGLCAGLAGGWAGDAAAAVLHVPTRLMMGWVAGVARWGASLGWPEIDRGEITAVVTVVATALAVWMLTRRTAPRLGAACAWTLIAAGIWFAASQQRPAVPNGPHLAVHAAAGRSAVEPSASGYPAAGHSAADASASHAAHGTRIDQPMTVVVMDRPDAAGALDRLRAAGVERIDALVMRSASRAAADAARALHTRFDIAAVYAPAKLGRYNAVTAPVDLGALLVAPDGDRLRVVERPG